MFLVWLVLGLFSSSMMAFMAYWDLKQRRRDQDPVTLWNVMVGAFLAWCPLVNFFVSIGMAVWFCTEVAPRIVLFGAKK